MTSKLPEQMYLGENKSLIIWDSYNIIIDTRDVGILFSVIKKEYEPDVFNALNSHILPGDCFIDVGANIGMHSLRFNARLKPSGLLYCFEPNPYIFEILVQNLHLNGGMYKTYPKQQAVYDCTRKVTFSNLPHQHRVGAIVLDGAINYGDSIYEVDCIELDSIDPMGRDVVLKIDVEGREGGVIAGGESLISKSAKFVVMEFHQSVMTSTGTSVLDLLQKFEKWGFDPFICHRDGLKPTSFSALESKKEHLNIAFKRIK